MKSEFMVKSAIAEDERRSEYGKQNYLPELQENNNE